eukprot:m51a1_g7403 hypothetical protein (366) ;mRNA; f:176305-177618
MDVSRIAGQFLRVLAIGLLPAFWSEIVRRALYAAGVSWPQLVVGASGVVAIAALNWLLVHVLGLGVIGSAVALSSSWAVQFVVLLAIIRASGYHRLVFAGGPSVEALKRGWKEMLTLAGSGYVMVCSEWWAFEILVFLAGLGGAVPLASFSTVMNLLNFMWMLPMSVGITASARAGFHLGANDPSRARFVSWMCIVVILLLELVYVPPLVFCGRYFAMVFSNDAAVIETVGHLAPYGALVSVQDGFNAVFSGILRGCGMQVFGAVCNVFFYYLVCIPAACLLLFVAKIGTKALLFGLAIAIAAQTTTFCIRVALLKWKEVAAAVHIEQGGSRVVVEGYEGVPLNQTSAEAEEHRKPPAVQEEEAV